MKRKVTRAKDLLNDERWTVAQDCYLIENQNLSIEALASTLPFTVDDIVNRRQLLGLERRAMAIMRMNNKERS